MNIHISPWAIVAMVAATVIALCYFVGKEACAVYCLFAIFSSILWIYRFIKAYQQASEHLEKHDMSVDISYMGNYHKE